jgi:hypothetical protein
MSMTHLTEGVDKNSDLNIKDVLKTPDSSQTFTPDAYCDDKK